MFFRAIGETVVVDSEDISGDAIADAAGLIDFSNFWRVHGSRFPSVTIVAQRYLSLQITSVACESFFSIAGYILPPVRQRMTFQNFRMLALLKANELYLPKSFLLDVEALSARGIFKSTRTVSVAVTAADAE